MRNTPAHSICYLDPAVEDALYTPGETLGPASTHPIDAMADDLATEWLESEVRPTWLENP